MNIGFIGLGTMGGAMAGHLANNNHILWVYNRSTKKSHEWQQCYSGHIASSITELAKHCSIIILCIGNDQDVHSVLTEAEGLLCSIKPGSLIIDHTTTSATLARNMHTLCIQQQVQFIDAPVSGGQQGAQTGQLTIMCGGDAASFERAYPFLLCYAKAVKHMGPIGHGQLTKMVNQICIAGVLQGLAEGLYFAEQAGLDPKTAIEAIVKGAAQSWQMENRHSSMIAGEYEHGFTVDLMRKDLNICLSEARKNGALLPGTALIDQFYAEVQHMGGGHWDTSSLLARLKNCKVT